MPTTYTDQFFVMDPGNPPARNTPLTVQKFNFVDQNDDGIISPNSGDTFNGLTITSVWVGDTITVRWGGAGANVTVTGMTYYTAGGPAVFTPTDGTILQDATFRGSSFVNTSTQIPVGAFGPPCFVAGTLIDTVDGPRAVEVLAVGDRVLTRDGGAQPIRWIGSRVVEGAGDFAPVRFAPALVGTEGALLVSPQHRMLLAGWRVELLFGVPEVLAAALHLVDGRSVTRAPQPSVAYFHLLFDRHEIVTAGQVLSESFHPGDYMLAGDAGIRAELAALFSGLAANAPAGQKTARRTARRVLRAHEAALLRGADLPLLRVGASAEGPALIGRAA